MKDFIGGIEKKFGKGAVMDMENGLQGVEFISSGSIALDFTLGGGYAKGRIVESYGGESSGKTTSAIHAMIEAQKLENKAVGFIDAENAFDPFYAENLGLDLSSDRFVISQPSNGEEALEIAENMVSSGLFSIVVIDSVAALTPKAELEGDMGDSKMGLHARLMSQAMRKMTSVISKTKTVLFMINQTRMKIGVMFGNPETTTGGNALKFYASQRLEFSKGVQSKDSNGEVIAQTVKVKVVKNKVAPPFRKAEIRIVFGEGFDSIAELIEAGVSNDLIKKSGAWFSYEGVKIGQGVEKTKQTLIDNPDMLDKLKREVLEKLGL